MRTAGLVILVMVILLAPGIGHGQAQMLPRPERPYRGLFASGVGETGQSLSATVRAGGGYDDNILFEVPGVAADPRIGVNGRIASLDGGLNYTYNTDNFALISSADSMFRYFEGRRDPTLSAYYGNLSGSYKFARRSTFGFGQNISYQPFIFSRIVSVPPGTTLDPLGSPVPGLGLDAPGIDQATSREVYLGYGSFVSLEHGFTQRLSFMTSYSFQRSDTAYIGGKFTTHRGAAGLRYAVSRGLGVRAGYNYQEGRFPLSSERAQSQNADIGLDYNKALSFSRRTTVSFATGTTAVTYGGSTSFQATGFARFNHEIGRTWAAYGGYSRSVQFVDLLLDPVLYDSVDVGVGGLLNRRVELQSGFLASIGNIGVNNRYTANDFDTFLASTTLSVALTRNLQLGGYYAFYRYRYAFGEGAFLPLGVAQNVDRQSIRVYLSLWAPLMHRARR